MGARLTWSSRASWLSFTRSPGFMRPVKIASEMSSTMLSFNVASFTGANAAVLAIGYSLQRIQRFSSVLILEAGGIARGDSRRVHQEDFRTHRRISRAR